MPVTESVFYFIHYITFKLASFIISLKKALKQTDTLHISTVFIELLFENYKPLSLFSCVFEKRYGLSFEVFIILGFHQRRGKMFADKLCKPRPPWKKRLFCDERSIYPRFLFAFQQYIARKVLSDSAFFYWISPWTQFLLPRRWFSVGKIFSK